ncbi:unnamed protein product [Citrullus colocynthis]|uniref:Uncharacterized protein n=1 Tax=Citrullus colocynthis TaxID=252529 RepID=A0ABP0YXH3_9ROSI
MVADIINVCVVPVIKVVGGPHKQEMFGIIWIHMNSIQVQIFGGLHWRMERDAIHRVQITYLCIFCCLFLTKTIQFPIAQLLFSPGIIKTAPYQNFSLCCLNYSSALG